MNISLETSMRLSQTLSPQMIQSLKLLQYNNLQLEQVIRKELQESEIRETLKSAHRHGWKSNPEIRRRPDCGIGL